MKKRAFVVSGVLALAVTSPLAMAGEAESKQRQEQYQEQYREQQLQLKQQHKAMHQERNRVHEEEKPEYSNRLQEQQEGFYMNGGNGQR